MNSLTVIIPNRDRLDPKNKTTQFLFKSLMSQTRKDFDILIADGGSLNYSELREYIMAFEGCNIMQRVIPEKFHKSLLNNVAIRSVNTSYIMTTDADMLFMPNFFESLIGSLNENGFIESRTCYLNSRHMDLIYSGAISPFDNQMDVKKCQGMGRIKKRTTPGGCQCGHRNIWEKIHGYDERYIGWGSEDVDLVLRVSKAGHGIKWMGESREDIMLFHQPHQKIDHVEDLKDQHKNLVFYRNIKTYIANPDGWAINNRE